MSDFTTIGFIGTGVMGEPMCRNLSSKLDVAIIAYDLRREPLERLTDAGVTAANGVAEVAEAADLILLSLPGNTEVEQVCLGEDGIAACGAPGLVVTDLSTCAAACARKVGDGLAAKRILFADAPVTRTAKAALDGTLSIMVGGDAALFDRLTPVLSTMGTDVTHAGPVGAGQQCKLLNNMVCVQTVVAIAEALTMARRAGVDPNVLFDILGKGSANSFALRNHGMNSMLPGIFREGVYPTRYALKDIRYALDLAHETGVDARGAELAQALLSETAAQGFAEAYYPALVKIVDDDLPED
jgi:hypothetical protein